jgi:hypothetical protein
MGTTSHAADLALGLVGFYARCPPLESLAVSSESPAMT